MNLSLVQSKIPSLIIKDSGWSECACPWCGDTKRHLQITPDWKWCRCFKCGRSVPIKELLTVYGINEFDNESAIEHYRNLEQQLKPILPLAEAMPFLEHPASIEYISNRGALDVAFFEKWMFAVCGKFVDRVIIPVTIRGTLYGIVGRTLVNTIPKYLFPSGFQGTQLMYHSDFLYGKKIFVLTEGVFDCITAQKALPFTGVVALFGKELSDYKAHTLLSLTPNEIVIMLDSESKDTVIETSVHKIAHKLPTVKVSVVKLPDGDANSLGEVEVQNAFYNRQTIQT